MKFNPDMDGESADVLACAVLTNPLVMEDNLVGACSICGAKIQYRPTAPKTPKKICMTCAVMSMIEEMEAGEEVEFGATKEAVSEARDYLRKHNAN